MTTYKVLLMDFSGDTLYPHIRLRIITENIERYTNPLKIEEEYNYGSEKQERY